MKLICAFCGFRNKADAPNCAQCGHSLADAQREKFRLPWASWLPAIPVALLCAWQISQNQKVAAALRQEEQERRAQLEAGHYAVLKKLETDFAKSEAELEARHQSLLRDDAIRSGRQAAERHALEWSRRQKHDPAFVSTLLEHTLVEVEKLGADPNLTPETSLRLVAEKICPPDSRIEVTANGSRFVVRVAFRLSALAPTETGSLTIHTSTAQMKQQIEEATARVIQAMFDFCGPRGIERISVSCNRALVFGDDGNQRLNMRSLYRASVDAAGAAKVASWREITLPRVKELMKVEHDMISRITFQQSKLGALPLDPNEPLEF